MDSDNNATAEENTTDHEDDKEFICWFFQCLACFACWPCVICGVLCMNEISGGAWTAGNTTTKKIVKCLCPCWLNSFHFISFTLNSFQGNII